MTARSLRWTLIAASLLGARTLAAQQIDRAAHERVAGCYAIEPAADAPWLLDVEPAIRLTLEPVPAEPGTADPSGSPQFVVRPASGERRQPTRYRYLGWSLFADGALVSVVWSSTQDQVALSFPRDAGRPREPSIGSTTFFSHEKMATTPPVDVRVTPIGC